MNAILVEILVLELAGAIRINWKKILVGGKAILTENKALELEKAWLIEILGEVEAEKVVTIEVKEKKAKVKKEVKIAPIKSNEGETLKTEETPDLPVVETTETIDTKVLEPKGITKTDIEAEADRLISEHSFKELADHAKSIGLTKTVWISAKDLAINIVEKSAEDQEKA